MKENNLLGGVFTEIFNQKNTINEFIENSKIHQDTQIDKFINVYSKLSDKISDTIEKLANVETIIQQIKATQMIPFTLKFSVVGSTYIYARTPFYDLKNDTIDIRVIVGKLEEYEDYLNNPVLHGIAIEKLTAKAKEQYNNTIQAYIKKYETKKKKENEIYHNINA
jgi:hypothetical protein